MLAFNLLHLSYALARPLLFSLDAELAHEITLKILHFLQHSSLQKILQAPKVIDPVKIAGINFPNRVGLAAGLDKNATCLGAWEKLGFGFAEVGTVTPVAQFGNPRPRLFRLPYAKALINRMGFNNIGVNGFVDNVRKFSSVQSKYFDNTQSKACPNMVIGLNIGKNAQTLEQDAVSDYLSALEAIYPYADYISINISSPNTANLRKLQEGKELSFLLNALSKKRMQLAQKYGKQKELLRVPFFVKISPDLDQIQMEQIAQILHKCVVKDSEMLGWGLIATNTTISRVGVEAFTDAQEIGGLSGAPLLVSSNKVVSYMRQALGEKFPIIGTGGIFNAEDALAKIKSGANLVQIYTGLIYSGPSIVYKIATILRDKFS